MIAARLIAAVAVLGSAICAHAGLQEQINAANPGDTIRVAPGIYVGALVIDKPLTLDGVDLPTIQGDGRDKVIRITAPGVTLRGLRVRGSGLRLMEDDAAIYITAARATIEGNVIEDSLHGIYLKRANDCRVLRNRITGKATLSSPDGSVEKGIGSSAENCDTGELGTNRRGNGIHQWNCERNEIAGNEIRDTRDGIYFSFTNHCRVTGNVIRRARYGLHYMYSDGNTFIGNTFSENAAGAAVMFSKQLVVRDNRFENNSGFRAYGLIFQSVDDSQVEQNRIEQNAVGLSFNQCNRNRVTGNRLARNYIALRFGSNSDENAFSLNFFGRNLHPVEITGDNGTNQWSIAGVGNRWENAAEIDLDHDGIADIPHRELDLFGVLRRDFPAIAFLSESPAATLLRFAHQRAALPGLHSIEDRAPLTAQFERRLGSLAQAHDHGTRAQ
jgi:nitrous oxidase accessory protein